MDDRKRIPNLLIQWRYNLELQIRIILGIHEPKTAAGAQLFGHILLPFGRPLAEVICIAVYVRYLKHIN